MLFIIGFVWWPMVEDYLALLDRGRPVWGQVDWLLLGIFAVMSLLIMAGADLRADLWIVLVGFAGGLTIESWGTQTSLWTYFTQERPPLWIIPAWPIASLAIDRLCRILLCLLPERTPKAFRHLYWPVFLGFYGLMLAFVWPTLDQSLTRMALVLCAFLILTPTDARTSVLTFVAGTGLGYFLELWGTTRLCWTYYTLACPPLFAVLAHGMAAVAFWRVTRLLSNLVQKRRSAPLARPLQPRWALRRRPAAWRSGLQEQ
jgi:hypothetical protein